MKEEGKIGPLIWKSIEHPTPNESTVWTQQINNEGGK